MGLSFAAPLAGRDVGRACGHDRLDDFNPRAPCGARPTAGIGDSARAIFQSTRPLRGATENAAHLGAPVPFQSTRPLRGATFNQGVVTINLVISIHAPLAGRDVKSL